MEEEQEEQQRGEGETGVCDSSRRVVPAHPYFEIRMSQIGTHIRIYSELNLSSVYSALVSRSALPAPFRFQGSNE